MSPDCGSDGAAKALTRRTMLACGLSAASGLRAAPRNTPTVAAVPLVDDIARAAIPIWQRLHPAVAIKVVGWQYADYHIAMLPAMSILVLLLDVMALESSLVGRFRQGGGPEDLSRAPHLIARSRNRLAQSDRFVRAFKVARRARRLKLDARVAAWSNEWAEGFKRGTLATELSGAWRVGQLSNGVAPQTHGLWRAEQLPQGANAGYGGAFDAIPRRPASERKALAWDVIRRITLDRERQLWVFKTYAAFLVDTELDNVLDRSMLIRLALADAQRLLERRAFQ